MFVKDLSKLRLEHASRVFSVFSMVSHDGIMTVQSLGNHVQARGDELRDVIRFIQGTSQTKIGISKFREFMIRGAST